MNVTALESITVTDCLGQTFPLYQCAILRPWVGDMDFGDPVALILPDGETITKVGGDYGVHLTDEDGEPVAFEDLEAILSDAEE